MSGERFTLDTNILVYALDGAAGARQLLADEIVERARFCDCWLTLQAISEFYAVGIRKRLAPIAGVRDQACDWLAMFSTVAASAAAVRAALLMASSGRASYWDALLLHTAAEAGCTAILTEDLADGATLAGLRIINPFAGNTLSEAAEAVLTGA